MKFDIQKLVQVFEHMKNRVAYGMNHKAPKMTCDSSEIDSIDCSGFVRYALYKSSIDDGFSMPDGSVQIHAWCASLGLGKIDYKNLIYTVNDNKRLFIAFLEPHNGHAGHVWFVFKGKTMESHGGVGVDSRSWDTPILFNNVSACYEIPIQ